jgi:hypothetical protein
MSLTQWAGWEALFIHGLTGLLFFSFGTFGVIRLALIAPATLVLVLPLFAFFAWGWWVEARIVVSATAWMRRKQSEEPK